MKTATKFRGLARRLKNAGLKIHGSDRSETIYVDLGGANLRISAHALGVADYGTRQQKHSGPEVVSAAEVGEVIGDCFDAARLWVRESAWHWSAGQRKVAAKAIRNLQMLARKMA